MTEPNWNWGEESSGPSAHHRAKPKPAPQQDYYSQVGQAHSHPSQYPQLESNTNSSNYFGSPTDQWQQWSGAEPAQLSNPYGTGNNMGAVPQFNGFSAPPAYAASAGPIGGPAGGYMPQNNAGYSMFPQQFMSDPLLNTARQIGGQFAEQQKEKFTKYLSSFHLKYYFAVDSNYVAKKLGIILFPFLHRDWITKLGQGGEPVPAKANN